MIHRQLHSAEIRERALALVREGHTAREVATVLNLAKKTVQNWARKEKLAVTATDAPPVAKARKGMSGVIAPAPFRKGFRWWNGRGEGWA